ncbi:MAG: hypothetical protein HFG26_13455 [Provencibacterium sp.]|jgi:hypothetical protein|nr:hypothetical protein [Provencibacterium sp.]
MTYCKRCGVRLCDGGESCVLCGSRTQPVPGEAFSDYPVLRYSNRMRSLIRLLALLSVVIVSLSLYIDYRFDSDTIWSFIVLGATIYGWTAFSTRKSLRNYGLMIFIQLIAISLLGYVIDISTGNHGWMLNYCLPFMIIAAQGIIVSMLIVRPMLFRDFLLYEWLIGIMGILSILLMVFDITRVRWPYITVCIYSVLLLVGTSLLADRKTKNELVKRFHI